jgi:hypothetical protein
MEVEEEEDEAEDGEDEENEEETRVEDECDETMSVLLLPCCLLVSR